MVLPINTTKLLVAEVVVDIIISIGGQANRKNIIL